MNILFVHEVDWLNKVVFDIHSMAELLSHLGHQVFAIDYEDSWQGISPFNFKNLKSREFDNVSRAIVGASVCLRRPGFIRVPVLSRLSAIFTHYLEIKRVIKEKNIDIIVLYSVPTNGLQTVYLARKFNIPVVFRSIDILHRMVNHLTLRPITKSLEKRVYSSADKILANAPRYLRYVTQMGVPESKIKLLLMPVDTELFRPTAESTELRQKWGIDKNDQLIVFIGTLFEFSGLDGFIRHFPQVLEQVPEAKLLIVGDGTQRAKLEQIIMELDLKRKVIITGFQPYLTMPQYINLATICINAFLNTEETGDIFPGKMLQYLACGKATVATPLAGITSILPGESHGVAYANAEGIVQEVVRLLKTPELRQQLGKAGLGYVEKAHSYAVISRQFETELKEAVRLKQAEIASRHHRQDESQN